MVNTSTTIDRLQMQSEASVGFNYDLLIEIFLLLPLTSILRFKSVSKHWQSLLSHPPFTLLYKGVSISLGFYVGNFYIPYDNEKRSSPPFRNLNFCPAPYEIKIVQSCNGLLLCRSNTEVKGVGKYYVFNPTTKQFAVIPPVPGAGDVGTTIRSMALAFHQTDCVQYKLVCIVKGFGQPFRVQIYSSDKARWKISDQSLKASCYIKCFGVYWNQAIYWSCHYMCFKLDTEELQEMPMPLGFSSYDCDFHGKYFGESGGYLHLAERSKLIDGHVHVNVYEMLNDHSDWFFKYRVELDDFLNAYPELIGRISERWDFQVLDVVRGEEEDDTFVMMQIAEKLIIRYNVADRSFKQISHPNLAYIYNLIEPREVHRYIATLATV